MNYRPIVIMNTVYTLSNYIYHLSTSRSTHCTLIHLFINNTSLYIHALKYNTIQDDMYVLSLFIGEDTYKNNE